MQKKIYIYTQTSERHTTAWININNICSLEVKADEEVGTTR